MNMMKFDDPNIGACNRTALRAGWRSDFRLHHHRKHRSLRSLLAFVLRVLSPMLKASFDKARDKLRQAASKSTTLRLKGYSEIRVSNHTKSTPMRQRLLD